MSWLCNSSIHLVFDSSKEQQHVNDSYRSPLEDSVFPRTKSAPSLTKVFLSQCESMNSWRGECDMSHKHFCSVKFFFIDIYRYQWTILWPVQWNLGTWNQGTKLVWKFGSFKKSRVNNCSVWLRGVKQVLIWVIERIERIKQNSRAWEIKWGFISTP